MDGKGLFEEQTRVEASKFEPFHDEHISRDIRLPAGYGKDKIIAIARDPWWFFSYWEITPERENWMREEMSRRGHNYERSILRVYDVTDIKDFNGKNANSYFDIVLQNLSRCWYIDVSSPERSFLVDIGMMTREGEFYVLARSNTISMPRFGASNVFDEQWMLSDEDYWLLYGASGGFGIGKSSGEMKEMILKRMKEWISSKGFISSFFSRALRERK